jgi:membrane protein YdbS with pleckstrin-like domain
MADMQIPAAFTNEAVAFEALPDFRRIELTPVIDAYRPWAVVTYAWFWLALALGGAVLPWLPFDVFSGLWWLALPPACIAAISVVYAVFDARHRAWALREHDLIYRYGVIWRKTVIVPFSRIQHIEAVHGPLERYLGLMRLKCFTAGGMTADLTVKGLDKSAARRVRQFLLEQIAESAATDDESGSTDEAGKREADDVDD